jgi:hypothetical protein
MLSSNFKPYSAEGKVYSDDFPMQCFGTLFCTTGWPLPIQREVGSWYLRRRFGSWQFEVYSECMKVENFVFRMDLKPEWSTSGLDEGQDTSEILHASLVAYAKQTSNVFQLIKHNND